MTAKQNILLLTLILLGSLFLALTINAQSIEKSCQNFPPPSFCPGGINDIIVTGTDNNGCSTYSCKSKIEKSCQNFPPSSFCPGGINDITVETLTGTGTIQAKKIGDKLQIESGKTSAISKETFVIEESKLYMRTSSGNKQIKVLPEEASSKATAVTKVNTIELKEESQQPIYSVKGTKQAKLLFVIPVSMSIETKVNAQSGNVISVKRPWWSFLAR